MGCHPNPIDEVLFFRGVAEKPPTSFFFILSSSEMMSFCCYERVDHRIQQPSWTFQQRFDSSRQANGTWSILPGRQGILRAHPQHGCESTNQLLNVHHLIVAIIDHIPNGI